ncbi:MAG: LysM peptidoglycan-binding domain-containing protein [Chloroflexota bacterium]|nr:LysM peptidoglycan-binding domain-containing protein [Chloroflexota bacterium]
MKRKAIAFIELIAMAALVMGVAVGCRREKPAPKPEAYAIPTSSPTPTLKVTATSTPTVQAPTPTPTEAPTATPMATEAPTLTPTERPAATPAATEVSTPTPMPTPAPGGFPYTVRGGDTLFSIAQRFGTTVEAIAQLNGITRPEILFAGQRLTIPGEAPSKGAVHIVQRGETLFSIALKYGTTVEAIASANRIFNPDFIFVGQRLVIPGGVAPAKIHTVKRGETLTSIALLYGTTPQAIAVANNLANPNLLYVGQMLRIP